jgi:hydroxyacylglutathione hydrolase
MKKTTRRILLAAGVVVALLVVLLGVFAYRLKTELDQMKPADTGQIVDGVYAIKDSFVDLYLVKGPTRTIAFDTGNDSENVRKGLESLGLNPADVAAVFLTHADSDHVGGLPLFPRATVYLPKDEEQMVDGRTARFFLFKNRLNLAHTPLSDGQTVEIDGLKMTTIFTPGHTPGSASYLVNGQYLFVGDTASLKSGKVGIFSQMINMDSDVQRESLRKLAGLQGVTHIFTAHHGYSGSAEQAFEAWRK